MAHPMFFCKLSFANSLQGGAFRGTLIIVEFLFVVILNLSCRDVEFFFRKLL